MELVAEYKVNPVKQVNIKSGAITESDEGVQVPIYGIKTYSDGIETQTSEEDQVKTFISGMIRRGDLTEAQWSDVLGIYPAWADYANGVRLEKDLLLTYESKLYKVCQPHDKQATYTPDICHALFVWITPPGVIPVWRQPAEQHDAWPVGSVVQWPEGGTIWDCTQGDAGGLNSWEPGVFGWTPRSVEDTGLEYEVWQDWGGHNENLCHEGDVRWYPHVDTTLYISTMNNNHWRPDSGTGWGVYVPS